MPLAALLALPTAAAATLRPVTWVSAGDRPGQAVMVGLPATAEPPLVTEGRLWRAGETLRLPVLQQGNGTVTLALPEPTFALDHWTLQLGCGAAPCSAPTPLFSPDVMWWSCGGAACTPGSELRLFGRRLAFDTGGCRLLNSSAATQGSETHLRLTPTTADAGGITIASSKQSCWDVSFELPATLQPGEYRLEVATSLGGSLGNYSAPSQTDLQTLSVAAATKRGTKLFRPVGRTGAAIQKALAAAAAHPGGGVVQLGPVVYTLLAGDTLVVGEGVTLRGEGMGKTTLKFAEQTLGTALARKHLGLIHGANTTSFWSLEDLAIVAPQADHLSHYSGCPVITDCGALDAPLDEHGLRNASRSCAGMVVSRVKITIDKTCPKGTAWPEETDYGRSCGGYAVVNTSYSSRAMLANVVPAVMILGRSAVLQDSYITHYGTCGSNVAYALFVSGAADVAIRRNVLNYGCAPYGFASVDGLIFESNQLIPIKSASGGGSNIDIFGGRETMRRMFYANNTQALTPGVPMHLETMTLDGGSGAYEGNVSVSADGRTLITAGQPAFATPPDSEYRSGWGTAAVLLLSGHGAGQWREGKLSGSTNTTWKLERPFAVAPDPSTTFAAVGKLEAQILFVANRWTRSHFQLYGMCLDCVVAENLLDGGFTASWGRNPHALVGGWQPNFQTEWLRNTVVGGTGITLMTSDQPLDAAGARINASYTGSLNWRVVLRGNEFEGGSGIGLGVSGTFPVAQTNGNVLVDSNALRQTCNLTTRPMPAGGDINGFLPCTSNSTCRLHDVVLHGNDLSAVRSCGAGGTGGQA